MEPTTLQINDFSKAIHANVTFCRKIMGQDRWMPPHTLFVFIYIYNL